MMNRRNLLKSLLCLPFVSLFAKKSEADSISECASFGPFPDGSVAMENRGQMYSYSIGRYTSDLKPVYVWDLKNQENFRHLPDTIEIAFFKDNFGELKATEYIVQNGQPKSQSGRNLKEFQEIRSGDFHVGSCSVGRFAKMLEGSSHFKNCKGYGIFVYDDRFVVGYQLEYCLNVYPVKLTS